MDFSDKSTEELLSFLSSQGLYNADEFALFQQQQQHNNTEAPDPSSVMFDGFNHNY
jgi:hypothetical protein